MVSNIGQIQPCKHLQTVLSSKANAAVKSTYQQAVAISMSINGSLQKCMSYTQTKDQKPVKQRKLNEYRAQVLQCSGCSDSNFYSVFICLQCPNVGCYAEHGASHARLQNHMFAIDSRNGLIFCFQCMDYKNHGELDVIRVLALLEKTGQSGLAQQAVQERESCKLDDKYLRPLNLALLGIKGIINLGATCFMSCILQTLIHNPLVKMQFFDNDTHFFNCPCQPAYSSGEAIDSSLACITCSVDMIFRDFYTSSSREGYGITTLLSTAWHKNKSLAGFQEQDAHEFWQFLLNEFHNDYERIRLTLHLNAGGKSSAGKASGDEKGHEHAIENGVGKGYSPNRTETPCGCIMHSTFLGELESSVICSSCDSVTKTVDPLIDISLEITNKRNNPSLQDCLDQFTRSEILEVKYQCQSCRKNTKAHKSLRIKQFPKVLSIQLKRFEHNFSSDKSTKINDKVAIPLFLDLSKYASKAKNDPLHNTDKKIYELFALVNHIGLVNTGHYITFIKSGSGQWLRFDDSVVSYVSQEEVRNTNAYLMFFITHAI